MRFASLLLFFLIGCDSGGPTETAAVFQVSSLEISAIETLERDGTPLYYDSDTLTGIFRFAVGARFSQIVSGNCTPTSSGECQTRLVLRATPIASELTLDTDIVADGETVPAGQDLRPLLTEASRLKVSGVGLLNDLYGRVYAAEAAITPSRNIIFDPARVRVPDGERTLTLRWTMPSGQVIEGSATFAYEL